MAFQHGLMSRWGRSVNQALNQDPLVFKTPGGQLGGAVPDMLAANSENRPRIAA